MDLTDLFEEITNKLKKYKLKDRECIEILENYNNTDWKEYIKVNNILSNNIPNNNKSNKVISEGDYYKNLVLTNDYIDLYIISWNINTQSPIHKHPDGGCLLKVLQGNLIEEVYENNKLIEVNIFNKNDIGYREKDKIQHKIINKNNISVSVHIYRH